MYNRIRIKVISFFIFQINSLEETFLHYTFENFDLILPLCFSIDRRKDEGEIFLLTFILIHVILIIARKVNVLVIDIYTFFYPCGICKKMPFPFIYGIDFFEKMIYNKIKPNCTGSNTKSQFSGFKM